MESNYKILCSKIAKEKNLDEEMLKSMFLEPFTEMKERMHKFSNLRYSIKNLITFFYGKSRLEKYLNIVTRINSGDLTATSKLYEKENPVEMQERIEKLLIIYEGYIQTKQIHKAAKATALAEKQEELRLSKEA